ncbi:MAG: hypothetical protein KIT09_34505 [Bryobacteraceae bacterium]|nr:hypothetical protein [Bryobacteraceae bacterium]
MTRVSIDRIVVDAHAIDPRDAESLRRGIEQELTRLIASAGLPEGLESKTRVQGGELPPSPGSGLPRMVAEQVVRALGGRT